MIIEKTPLEDLLLISPKVHYDERGYFMESYNKKNLDKFLKIEFVQDNESLSQKHVLRGLHFQKPPYAQAKLVQVISGSVLDIAVDLRKNSSTYGKYFKHILSSENKKQMFIPKGFAHGFLCLENNTIFSYKCSNYYHKESEGSIRWNDPNLAIDWEIETPILAEKDKTAENFLTFDNPF